MTRRVKISFSEENKDRVEKISSIYIIEANKRVKEEMKGIIRVYEKNETQSQKDAARLVLNA